MKVLAIMPTYGRLPFLGRAVASFLSQTHDDKELVIINDDPNVTINCSEKNVYCINLNKKMLVGEKRNMGVSLGDYDLYMPFDDDDIFMPNRMSNHIKRHVDNPDVDLYRNKLAYTIYGDQFHDSPGTINGISFTKRGWLKCSGYTLKSNFGEDKHFEDSFENKLVIDVPEERDYVYNFGGINYHLSNTRDADLSNLAKTQLKKLDLLGKVYNIVPDFEEFNKFIELEKLYKEKGQPIKVKHLSLGKFDIIK